MAYRIYILGAGFSKPAGLPLGAELFPLVLARARRLYGEKNAIEEELDDYLVYRERADGIQIPRAEVDFEAFMAHLDVEHSLRLLGGDTQCVDGNAGQMMLRRLIGQVIHSRTPCDVEFVPSAYHRFVDQLDTTDTVITWNYDVLLERLLAAHGKPFRRFSYRASSVSHSYATIDSSIEEITILKPHGSVDWIYRRRYDESAAAIRAFGMDSLPRDPCFGPHARHEVRPLTQGPRHEDDELARMFELTNPDEFYAEDDPPTCPYILSPSAFKVLYAAPLLDLWSGLSQAGGLNLGLAIIGFSLPQHDEYIRRVVYEIARNYQHFQPNLKFGSMGKGPVRLIDFRPDSQSEVELRARYRFLDWSRTRVHLSGFDDLAVEMLRD